MNRAEYDSLECENFSNIKRILDSPAAYKYGKPDPVDATHFAVGNLAHAMVLENKDLRDLYVRKPDGMSFASKEGKAWKAGQTLPILTAEEWDMIPAMAEAVAQDNEASALIRMCPQRESLLTGMIQGVEFKGIADGLGADSEKFDMILDLKTVIDARPHKFKMTINDLHYDLQDEIYVQLLARMRNLGYRPKTAWVCVEKSKPYEVACYYPDSTMIEIGEMKLQACIDRIKKCRAANKWPKSLGGLHEITPPAFAMDNARRLLDFSL
jgi:hypothetical protein